MTDGAARAGSSKRSQANSLGNSRVFRPLRPLDLPGIYRVFRLDSHLRRAAPSGPSSRRESSRLRDLRLLKCKHPVAGGPTSAASPTPPGCGHPNPGPRVDPAHVLGHSQGAVRFDGDVEAEGVQGVDQRAVELQERLTAGADGERQVRGVGVGGKLVQDGDGEVAGVRECSTAAAVRAEEVCVAPPATRRPPVPVPSRPDHRLQPANRTKMDGRPVFASSPCNV